jgi:hypothetical protein
VQVAHVQDHITHAVMGANSAVSFGISESAEFFNILSNSLYSDKPLAVAREILCNAWDAHLISGRTDTPIEITLNGKELVIRDRGAGIHKALMHSVYCVYGASTKVESDVETGGFGLGCKVPFAYVEHFEVTNHNEGMKTIYRISKTSGETGGKPGLMEILSVPTDETGIEVRIELKSPQDTSKFSEAICRVVAGGEMNALMNGNKLATLPFSEAKEGYLITNQTVGTNTGHKIFVRYGAVIYPIESHEDYRPAYNTATQLLTSLANAGYGWKLVLQAKAKTVSITPSRESLSMTDRTIETLGKLLKDFNDIRGRRQVDETRKINVERVQQTFLDMKPGKVLDTTNRIIGLTEYSLVSHTVMTDFSVVALSLAAKSYPSFPGFRQQDIELRLRSLIASNYGNRGKIQTFLSEYQTEKKLNKYKSTWFMRRLVSPLLTDMKDNPDVSADRLLVYGHNYGDRQERISYSANQFHPAKSFSKGTLEQYLPFLRNLVILSNNRADVTERAQHFPQMKHWFGDPSDSLVYIVHRSDAKIAAARAFFAKHGFTVVDLTRRYKGEPAPIVVDREPREFKARKSGLPLLSSILPEGKKLISTDKAKAEDVPRIEKPEFVVKIGSRLDTHVFEDLNRETCEDIVRLFGSRGGIAVNQAQVDKFVSAGAKPMLGWVFDRVIEWLKASKTIESYLSVDFDRLENLGGYPLSYDDKEIVKLIQSDDVLKTYYGLDTPTSTEDGAYLRLFNNLASMSTFRWSKKDEIEEVRKLLKSFPVGDSVKELATSVRSSPFTSSIDAASLGKIFKDSSISPNINMRKAKARDLLIFAIAG